jgi:hypothetical protein
LNNLKVDGTWAKQIENIRNAHSDATDIPRSSSESYRICCSAGAAFTIKLSPSTAGHSGSLDLHIGETNFYIHKLGVHDMERYSSKIKTDEQSKQKFLVSEGRLNSAIHDLIKSANETAQFENVTLLTFCIAESLRCEAFARDIEATLQAYGSMSIQRWVPLARHWAATSKAIRESTPIRPDLKTYAAGISVLCRSG